MDSLTYEKEIKVKLMNKWYDVELSNLNKIKYKLYQSSQESGSWDEYNTVKRKYKKLIRQKYSSVYVI